MDFRGAAHRTFKDILYALSSVLLIVVHGVALSSNQLKLNCVNAATLLSGIKLTKPITYTPLLCI